jgi:hypothetical protein
MASSLSVFVLALLLCACGSTNTAPAEVTRIANQIYATQTAQARVAAATRAPTRAAEPSRTALAGALPASAANAATGDAIEFVITDNLLWAKSATNGYTAEGEDDTFAWSRQGVAGDFELSADVESDWENYGEAMVVVYGDGQSWTPGCLIFNVTGYWQSIRAHSVYDPEIEWVARNEEQLDRARKRYRMTVRIADGEASLLVDDELVLSAPIPADINQEGYIGLAKYGGSAPVSFTNIVFRAEEAVAGARPNAPAATATPKNTPTPTNTPQPSSTPLPTATPTPSPTPEPEAIVRAAALRVREGPGERFTVLGELSAGLELDVIGQQGACEWLWVGYGGKAGWVAGNPDWVELRRPCDDIPPGLYRELTGYLKRSADGGALGELTVENGTEEDAVVILTLGDAPFTSAYIRAGESFTLNHIRDGSFEVYFATGSFWDGDSFTQTSSRRKFDEQLSFTSGGGSYTTWSVTLHAVAGGQASAGRVGEDAFPDTGQ